MTMEEHIPWPWLVLGILDDFQGENALQDIYLHIEEQFNEMRNENTELIRPELFKIDPRYGVRPKYQHTVRGCLSNYVKRGLVERTDRAVYQITSTGSQLLRWYKEHY